MDIGALLKAKSAWDRFTKNHPKFPAFLNAAKAQGIREGAIIEIRISNPGEETLVGNIKVTADDMDLFNSLSK